MEVQRLDMLDMLPASVRETVIKQINRTLEQTKFREPHSAPCIHDISARSTDDKTWMVDCIICVDMYPTKQQIQEYYNKGFEGIFVEPGIFSAEIAIKAFVEDTHGR